MTTSPGGPDDEYWRRNPDPPPSGAPAEPTDPAWSASDRPGPPGTGSGPATPAYPGPPPTLPPPAGWRPPLHVQPPPPRQLPAQDLAGLAAAEDRARRITYLVGGTAGVLALLVMCLLCARILP